MRLSISTSNRFRLFFGVQFAGIGIYFSFIALYLNSLELTGAQLGLLFALIPLISFLVQPLWGFATDIYHRQRIALVVACFGVAAAMIGMAQAKTFWPILLFTVLHAVMMAPIGILVTALALEHLNRQSAGNFGALRLWGSIGYAISTFGIGTWLLDQGNIWWILPLYGLCNLILGLLALSLPDADVHGQSSWQEGVTLLQRQRGLALFLFAIMLIGFTHGIVNYYLSVYLSDIQAAGWVIGVTLALAAVFDVDASELILIEEDEHMTPFDAVKTAFMKFANFSDTATRFEYWWFFLFFLLTAAIATILHEKAYQIVTIIFLLPFIAVGTRRLNDAGRSGWWQLFFLVPFGQIVVLYLLAQESKSAPAPHLQKAQVS